MDREHVAFENLLCQRNGEALSSRSKSPAALREVPDPSSSLHSRDPFDPRYLRLKIGFQMILDMNPHDFYADSDGINPVAGR